MRRLVLLLAAAALAGCATVQADRLPVCDGKHRRPANPNGSVLAPPPARPGPPDLSPTLPALAFPGCGG